MDVEDEANDWPDGLPLWTARVLYHVKEYLDVGMDEEALAYVDNRLELLFTYTGEYWSAYERWLSNLEPNSAPTPTDHVRNEASDNSTAGIASESAGQETPLNSLDSDADCATPK